MIKESPPIGETERRGYEKNMNKEKIFQPNKGGLFGKS
jgi:hypothetical protein